MTTAVYKIRNKLTGTFSSGGTSAPRLQWVEGGKVFHSISALKAHLTAIKRSSLGIMHYQDAEIVQYILILTTTFDVGDLND